MRGIEFVCSGNNGRSPMAQVVAEAYVRRIGADIPIYSSGVELSMLLAGNLEPDLLETAKAAGIDGNTNLEIFSKIQEIEAEFRNLALEKRGFAPPENHIPRQTQADSNILMLTVGEGQKNLLLSYLVRAKVFTIEEYSGVPVPKPGLMEWLTDVNVHLAYLGDLMIAVPKVVDRYLVN